MSHEILILIGEILSVGLPWHITQALCRGFSSEEWKNWSTMRLPANALQLIDFLKFYLRLNKFSEYSVMYMAQTAQS